MEKDLQRLKAVKANDFQLFESLADDTEWYKFVEPETGNTFLHLTVLQLARLLIYCTDIFYYLVQFADFPLDHKNKKKQTVLDICFEQCKMPYDGFVCELIKRGASLDSLCLCDGKTLLHFATKIDFVEVTKLLLSMGYDADAKDKHGLTPLWYSLRGRYVFDSARVMEIVRCLLWHGADATMGLTPERGIARAKVTLDLIYVQEELFPLTFDEHTVTDIHLDELLCLAEQESKFFHQILEDSKNVIVCHHCLKHNEYLFSIKEDDLKLLIKKFPNQIKKLLSESKNTSSPDGLSFLENINILLESEAQYEAIDFIQNCIDRPSTFNIIDSSIVSENPHFFLSYGIKLKFEHLVEFQRTYGFDELLKLTRNTEIKMTLARGTYRYPMLVLLCEFHADFEDILHDSSEYSPEDVGTLLGYFSHPKLREICSRYDKRPEIIAKVARQPRVPLLAELARTASRKSLANTFQITNTSEFYEAVDKLLIPTTLKRVLTLEKKLY